MPSSSNPEETPDLVERLDRGDLTAIDPLLSRHYERMLAHARDQRLRYGLSEAEYGDEDAVNDALLTLCQRVRARKLPALESREGYWKRILRLLKRKVRLARERRCRKRRGGSGIKRPVARPSSPPGGGADQPPLRGLRHLSFIVELDERLPPIPPAEQLVDDEDELRYLMDHLDQKARVVLLLSLQSYTAAEISERLGITSRTVRRKLVLIRYTMRELGLGMAGD